MKKLVAQLATVVCIGATLGACDVQGSEHSPMVNPANTPTAMEEHKTDAVLYEVIERAPTDLSNQDDWDQWENSFVGIRVSGKGRFSAFSIHPGEGKLFLIITLNGKDASAEDNAPQIAFLVKDVHFISLGEEEGSILIDDRVWIQLGRAYILKGMVSGFSRFDAELEGAEFRDLVIISGSFLDLKEVNADENSVGMSTGAGDVRPATPTVDLLPAGNLPSTLTAVYSEQGSEASVSPLWDISKTSCDGKPIHLWGQPGTYLYEGRLKNGGYSHVTVERNAIDGPDEDPCRMPWPDFGDRLPVPPIDGFQMNDYYQFCDYDRSRPAGPITISAEGTEVKSVGFGTYQAVRVTTLQSYNFYDKPPNYPLGDLVTNEWYACGLGLISSSTSHAGNYQHRDFEVTYGMELISFTPASTNEAYVRFILTDVQLGNLAEQYRTDVTNEETAEALRRWDAGIRVENIEMFERKVIQGQWRIVFLGTEDPVSGDAITLTSDQLPQS